MRDETDGGNTPISGIVRHTTHEEWNGIYIGSYRYRVDIPKEIRGSTWDWGYCSHWSTHPGAEPLVSLHDVVELQKENDALKAALKRVDDIMTIAQTRYDSN